jgi:hypothetical protein
MLKQKTMTFYERRLHEKYTVHASTDLQSFYALMRTKTLMKDRLELWKMFFNQGRELSVNKRGYFNTKEPDLKRLLKEGFIKQKRIKSRGCWTKDRTRTTVLVKNIK